MGPNGLLSSREMSDTARVLAVDDEESIRRILELMLSAEGYQVVPVATLEAARGALSRSAFHVVLTDLRLEGEHGLDLLRWMREQGHSTPVVILTAHGTVDSAVDAMKQGAFDYLTKPFDRRELLGVIRKGVLTCQLQTPREPGVARGSPLAGRSEKMAKVSVIVDKVAPSDSTVLVTGESGTGKEVVAQEIHDRSRRAQGPFIKINCAAIPATLMESELFGHEKGAFTGATNCKPGRFELADGGTLFLDEIGEMSTEMQVKLLRVLQDRSFERVGGIRTIHVDVRLITATNKDIDLEVRQGRFREDLYYRLNVVRIHLPPLREREGEVVPLVGYFAKKFAVRMSKPEPVFEAETMELLAQYHWPGNIRQLENAVERLIVLGDGGSIGPGQLPEDVLEFEEERFRKGQGGEPLSLRDQVREVTRRIERRAIEEALAEMGNNVTQAARRLNVSRKGLQIKMKELGLR